MQLGCWHMRVLKHLQHTRCPLHSWRLHRGRRTPPECPSHLPGQKSTQRWSSPNPFLFPKQYGENGGCLNLPAFFLRLRRHSTGQQGSHNACAISRCTYDDQARGVRTNCNPGGPIEGGNTRCAISTPTNAAACHSGNCSRAGRWSGRSRL